MHDYDVSTAGDQAFNIDGQVASFKLFKLSAPASVQAFKLYRASSVGLLSFSTFKLLSSLTKCYPNAI